MGFLRWGALCSTSRWDRIGRGFGPLRASGAAVCEMCSSHLGRVSSTVRWRKCASDTMCPRSSTRHGHLSAGVMHLLELLVLGQACSRATWSGKCIRGMYAGPVS